MEALMEKIRGSARKVVEEVCRVTAGERVLIITGWWSVPALSGTSWSIPLRWPRQR